MIYPLNVSHMGGDGIMAHTPAAPRFIANLLPVLSTRREEVATGFILDNGLEIAESIVISARLKAPSCAKRSPASRSTLRQTSQT
jgi:hypothetical protein